ncbi:collagen alpha-1(I) chain-like [Elephas maximus indicus]|uniref:collagen alpha-1(I) chain-like n=1 Tax=Elephas maximus indicus TaxID=99487 RepID=UPI0021169736|nr:collagen alpha-1(I) chain-like [Elephas maximus indicus]
MKTEQSPRDADGSLWARPRGASWVTGPTVLHPQAPVPAGLGGVEFCGSGSLALPPPPEADRSCPAGCKTPSWVKVQPLGAPHGIQERDPLRTSGPPLPTQSVKTYSTGLAAERGKHGGEGAKGGEINRRTEGRERVPPRREAPEKRSVVWQPEGRGPQRQGAGGGRGRALDPRQLGPRRVGGGHGGLGEGSGVKAGHGPRPPPAPKLGVSRGARTRGRRPRYAASSRPRPSLCRCEAFKDTSAPAQRGGRPGNPHPRRSQPHRSYPRVFRPLRPPPGILARPRPAPTLRRRRHRARAPTARGGGREEPGTTPPPPLSGPPQGGVPPSWALSPPLPPLPDPLTPRTPSHRWPKEDRSVALPVPAPARPPSRPRGPPGSPAPPGQGGRGAGGRGGGPGRARLPFSAAAAEPARGPTPAPLPRSLRAAAEADDSGSGSAPSSSPPASPRRRPGAGAQPGRRGRPGRAPAAAPSWAPQLRPAVEGPPAALGLRAGSRRDGRGRLPSPRGHKQTLKSPAPPRPVGPAVPARSVLAPRAPGTELQGSRSVSQAGHCPPPCPPPGLPWLPPSPPASGLASQAARSGAHYRVAGRVGPAGLRALVPRRRVPARPLLSPPPPPPPPPAARPPRPRWPRPRRCLAGPGGSAYWGAPGRRGGSGLGARPVLAPSARLPASAARRGTRTLGEGGPNAPIPQLPDPTPGLSTAPRPSSRPLRAPRVGAQPGALQQPSPRGAPCYLALPLRWVPASSTGRRDSSPSSPPAGVKCLPPLPAEPPAAFALQFSRPPPEPTALCRPQHWGWGQQRRPIRASTPTPPATPARCRGGVEPSPLSRAKVGAPAHPGLLGVRAPPQHGPL